MTRKMNRTEKTAGVMLWSLVVILLFSVRAPADESLDKIEKYMLAWHEAGQFNGTALVAENDRILFEKGYGLANIEWNIPNSPETKFNIGSISKQFTTVLVFQLCEAGKLGLQDPITKYFDNINPKIFGEVTIDHLLQHTSGMPCFLRDKNPLPDGTEFNFLIEQHYQTSELLAKIFSRDLLFEPGSTYRYSNSNFFLLKEIIAKVSGKSYERMLKEKIIEPLALEGTGLIREEVPVARMAEGYQVIGDRMGVGDFEYSPNIYGAGGIYSTVRDLLKWNLGIRSKTLLSKEWEKKMFTPYWNSGGAEYAYSQTLQRIRLQGFDEPVSFYSFNGASKAGFISDVMVFPKTGQTVVLLDNSEEFHHWEIGPGLYSILNGITPRLPLASAGDALTVLVRNCTVEEAAQKFKKMEREKAGEYDFRFVEDELNTYGYRLMKQAVFDEAGKLFALNLALFPSSPNAANSYGEYYLRIGKKQPAQAMFEREERIRGRERLLTDLLKQSDFERLQAEIEKIRQTEPTAPLFRDNVIGPIFGKAMGSSEIEKAIAIARIWEKGNPESASPLFSLAAAYRRSGDDARAIECYQKIIEMNPVGRNAEAAKMQLERIKKK